MRIALKRICLTFAVVVMVSLHISAQSGGNSLALSNVGNLPPAAMPFPVGEKLTYEGKLSKIIRGIAIADLSFTITQPQPGGDYVVASEARSKGTLVKLFRFSFLQEIESTFGGNNPQVKLTKKHDVQKERVRDSEAIFDYQERRVTYTETDPKEPMRPPRRIASEIVPETHDIVSAIYRLRMMPLSVGAQYEFTVSDSGLVYKVPVKVTGREQLKTAIGKVWCFRVEPDVFGPGRIIERDGSMIIWMTDDHRHLPVRAQVNSPFGKIDIKLKSAKGVN